MGVLKGTAAVIPEWYIDRNEDNMINFKEFVDILCKMCKADYTQRLKLLYELHQPPCLLDNDDLDTDSVSSPKSDCTEPATEATSFFDEDQSPDRENADDIELPSCPDELDTFHSTTEAQEIPSAEGGDPVSQSIVSSLTDSDPPSPGDKQVDLESSLKDTSVSSQGNTPMGTPLGESPMGMFDRRRDMIRDRSGSKEEFRNVPRLSQNQFIQMWKTLYDIFGGEPNEQELYHSIATVGTLLLEIGEVGKKFYLQKEDATNSMIDNSNESASDNGSLSLSSVPEIKEEVGLDETSMSSNQKTDDKTAETSTAVSEDASIEGASKQLEELSVESSSLKEEDDQSRSPSDARSGLSLGNIQRGERTISTSSSKVDVDWSISFEQFLASMLTESALVKYFEQRIDLQDAVDKTRNRRLLMRQQSAPFEQLKSS